MTFDAARKDTHFVIASECEMLEVAVMCLICVERPVACTETGCRT